MVAPVLAVGSYAGPVSATTSAVAGGVTATLGVLFRSTARNLMRSTLGAMIRTASRTATRRVVRRVLQTLFATVLRSGLAERVAGPSAGSAVGLGLGVVGLAASLGVVLWRAPTEVSAEITAGLSIPAVALLGAVPMVTYGLGHLALARALGHRVTIAAGADGLLLQAYFTLAGSFLPLTTEVESEGSPRTLALAGAASLAGMVALHFVLRLVAQSTGDPGLHALSSLYLVYAFVFSFPLPPLDGSLVWAQTRLGWLLVWLGIGWVFVRDLPERFYAVL